MVGLAREQNKYIMIIIAVHSERPNRGAGFHWYRVKYTRPRNSFIGVGEALWGA